VSAWLTGEELVVMAGLTASVKDELSRLPAGKTCCRRAELAALLRFAGGLHLAGGRVAIEAELDSGMVTRRLRREIAELYGHPTAVRVLPAAGLQAGPRYLVRVQTGGAALARSTGLVDQAGRPLRGLPANVVSGGGCDAAAAWRGAFLAHGWLSEPGRSAALEVAAPSPEAALALVGAARRLGVVAKTRQVRNVDWVRVRDSDAIEALLSQLGASKGVLARQQRQLRHQVPAAASTIASFDSANQRRSARAAATGVARVHAATVLLQGAAPEHLLAVGRLRLQHPQATLEQLGEFADPPMTKDAVAGQLRRLFAVADRRAISLGVPTTQAAVSPKLLEAASEDYRTRPRRRPAGSP